MDQGSFWDGSGPAPYLLLGIVVKEPHGGCGRVHGDLSAGIIELQRLHAHVLHGIQGHTLRFHVGEVLHRLGPIGAGELGQPLGAVLVGAQQIHLAGRVLAVPGRAAAWGGKNVSGERAAVLQPSNVLTLHCSSPALLQLSTSPSRIPWRCWSTKGKTKTWSEIVHKLFLWRN